MDQETYRSRFSPRLTPGDKHNLEGAGDFITQSISLHLAGDLPEGQTANDKMLKKLNLLEEHTTVEQFVFHGQCLVLGDSGVGKTSLVNSLTGKPFDPRQPKTKGIDQCLVDEKWKNLSMKDLIFGNLFRFYQNITVQLTLYGPEIPFYFASLLRLSIEEPFVFSIYLLVFVFYFVLLYFVSCNSHFRLIVTAPPRRLLIGAFPLLITLLYDYGNFSVNANGMLLNRIIQGVLVSLLMNQWFRNELQCSYPRQRKFMKYHRSLYVYCLLPLAVLLVSQYSFIAVVFLLNSWFNIMDSMILVRNLMLVCVLQLTFELGKSAAKNMKWPTREIYEPVVTFMLTLILLISLFIPLDTYMNILYTYRYFNNISICILLNIFITVDVMEKPELNKKMLKSALNKKFSSIKLKILDFAGDKEFYAYHMFLRREAIYIIVFNMADFAVNDFREIDTKVKRLQFWFESVCSHVPHSTPIVLVGTHRGRMDENCMEILDGHLRRYLWKPYCDELVVNDDGDLMFFPVENFDGQNDIGIQCLQKAIVSVAELCKETIGRNIPLSWIRVQDAVISLREKKEAKFCVTLDEFPRVFHTSDNFICKSWSKETLKYFHEKGLVIYLDRKQDLDLSNWVLLKPEILVDIIIQLVTPSPENTQERGLKRHRRLLQKKGFLSKSLLINTISKVKENEEAITAFLEEYDLICPLAYQKVKTCSLYEDDEQPTHFVPCLLPMSAEEDTPMWYDDDTDKTFYIFFTRFLPEPLFHGLLSRAHKLSKLEFPNGQTVLFRDAGRFWMSAWQPYCLKLMKEEKMIEVTFSCRKNHRMKPSDVLCQVFSMVDGICKRDFPFVKFYCGPACPSHKCPGHQSEYLSYSSAGEEQVPRRHVYNVMPGRQGDRIASLYCENHSFEEELDEWVP